MAKIKTYEDFIIKQIMPADGWQVAFHEDKEWHILLPLHVLALAYRVDREDTVGGRIVPPLNMKSEEEFWDVVGLWHRPGSGWAVCDTLDDYCGLLSPGMTLETFLEYGSCLYSVKR